MGKKIIDESELKVMFYMEHVKHPNYGLFSMEDLLPTEYNLKKAITLCKKMGFKVICDSVVVKDQKLLTSIGIGRINKK